MSTLRTITDFKSRLKGGGARNNLFEVSIPEFPEAARRAGAEWGKDTQETFQFMCKAAALPASTINEIPVPFRGRVMKVAGDRTFEPWTITVINDENFKLRTAFEYWVNAMSKSENNTGATDPGTYMKNAVVYQLGRGAGKAESNQNREIAGGTAIKPLRTYLFRDIFPTEVSSIDLSYDQSDSIEEFTVTFQVQYWIAGTDQETGGAKDANGQVIR